MSAQTGIVAVRPDELSLHIDTIIARWSGKLRANGGEGLREDERGAVERRLVRAMIEVGLHPREEWPLQALSCAAAAFGVMEPMRHLDPQRVLEALFALRHTLWEMLEESARVSCPLGGWAQITHFILGIDEAMELACRAAIGADRLPPATAGAA